jgi:hypothetical protein
MADYLLCKAQEAEKSARVASNDAERKTQLERARFFRSQAELELSQNRRVN